MRYFAIIIATIVLVPTIQGCGKSNDAKNVSTASDAGAPLLKQPNVSQDAVTHDQSLWQGQQTVSRPIDDSETSSSETNSAAISGGETAASTRQQSSVSGVEKVAGPHGPFPTESVAPADEPTAASTAPPAEEPKTTQGPFGPFPTSP